MVSVSEQLLVLREPSMYKKLSTYPGWTAVAMCVREPEAEGFPTKLDIPLKQTFEMSHEEDLPSNHQVMTFLNRKANAAQQVQLATVTAQRPSRSQKITGSRYPGLTMWRPLNENGQPETSLTKTTFVSTHDKSDKLKCCMCEGIHAVHKCEGISRKVC
ncbi:hypothetical protein PR048_029718 [Dryococelus australis]|uniref:Uncharacterized protein n=1 Tax=Dryococelus australis TaxID=614101 RepID=A0ABQ9GE63_9NEOP|nr:hypothetical protein PR048_029718 [Dryococelus australis]